MCYVVSSILNSFHLLQHSLRLKFVARMLANKESYQNFLDSSQEDYFEELRNELEYFKRTKIVTLLDMYRIKKKLLPMVDVWIALKEVSYSTVLKIHENLLLDALRSEDCLSEMTKMVNENKYILRSIMKKLLELLVGQ